MSKIDFSNEQPTRFVNIDEVKRGKIHGEFEAYSNTKMSDFTRSYIHLINPIKTTKYHGLIIHRFGL